MALNARYKKWDGGDLISCENNFGTWLNFRGAKEDGFTQFRET